MQNNIGKIGEIGEIIDVDAIETGAVKRVRVDDDDLLRIQQDEIRALTNELRTERRNNVTLTVQNRELQDEYVNKLLKIDKVYSDVCRWHIDGVSQAQTNRQLKDGRPASYVIKLWLKNQWNISDNAQFKMFTTGGCIVAPSHNIGTKRKVRDTDITNNINNHNAWIFVDVTNFPNIRYVVKNNDKVLALSQQVTKGHIKSFDSIINA